MPTHCIHEQIRMPRRDCGRRRNDRLKKLNGALGESSERLSLLAANCKRRGKATTGEARKAYFQAAADFYQKAYQHTKKTQSSIDPYPGLNAVALSYVAGGESEIADECLKFAAQQKDYPNFWERVYRPDALLLGYLRAGDLGAHAERSDPGVQRCIPARNAERTRLRAGAVAVLDRRGAGQRCSGATARARQSAVMLTDVELTDLY